jgi:hypothetical protein
MVDGAKPRQINFRLPEADAQRLDALAAAEHRTTPDYVRAVVLRHCFPGETATPARAAPPRSDEVTPMLTDRQMGKRK